MTSVIVAVLIVLAQTACGAFWWRLARGRTVRLLEALGMGVALGTAAATVSGVLLFPLVPGGWAWAVPAIVTAIAAPLIVHRHPRILRDWRPTAWAPAIMALAVGCVLGLASIAINLRNYPLTFVGTISSYHQDMPFFEALSTSLARLGPSDSIFMSGADLRYHWFAYAWTGQIAQTAGTAPFFMLTRLLPVVALLGSLIIAVAWAQRLTRNRWAPTLAAVLLVFGGYVGASYGTILNFDSPSQAFVTVWMLGLSVALLSTVSRRGASRSGLIGLLSSVAVLSVATTGGKINSAAVVVVGWIVVVLVAQVRREVWVRRAWATAAVLLVSAAATYVAYLAGSAEQGGLGLGSLLNKASSVQGLNPSDAPVGIIAGTVILAVAVLPRWAGLAWLVAAPSTRWRPLTTYGLGVGAAGILALLLFSGGMNDSWFALSASAPLSVISAVGVAKAVHATVPGHGWRVDRRVLLAVVVGVLLTAVVLALWNFGPGSSPLLRWTAPLVGVAGAIVAGTLLSRLGTSTGKRRATSLALTVVVLVTLGALGRVLSFGSAGFAVQAGTSFSPSEFKPFEPFTTAIDQRQVLTWSDDMVAAADYLRANVAKGELVATNIAFSPLVPALSGTTMYIAAIQYQAPYGRPDQLTDLLARERRTWDFVDQPSAQSLEPLCSSNVRWLWVDPTRTKSRAWEPYATVVVEEQDVIILRVNPSAC